MGKLFSLDSLSLRKTGVAAAVAVGLTFGGAQSALAGPFTGTTDFFIHATIEVDTDGSTGEDAIVDGTIGMTGESGVQTGDFRYYHDAGGLGDTHMDSGTEAYGVIGDDLTEVGDNVRAFATLDPAGAPSNRLTAPVATESSNISTQVIATLELNNTAGATDYWVTLNLDLTHEVDVDPGPDPDGFGDSSVESGFTYVDAINGTADSYLLSQNFSETDDINAQSDQLDTGTVGTALGGAAVQSHSIVNLSMTTIHVLAGTSVMVDVEYLAYSIMASTTDLPATGYMDYNWNLAIESVSDTDPANQQPQVAEPGTLLLLGAGMFGLAALRRRRTRLS